MLRFPPLKRLLTLPNLILAGIALGVVVGALAGGGAPGSFLYDLCDTLGAIFLNLLKAVMIPLVIASLFTGMVAVGDPRKLGRIGAKTLAYFLLSAAVAVFVGLVCVNTIRPGRRVPEETRANLEKSHSVKAAEIQKNALRMQESWSFWSFVRGFVPSNIIRSMVEGDLLPIIVFTLLLGFAATLLPEERRTPLVAAMSSLNDALLKLVEIFMWMAPAGAFGLMAKTIMESGLGILSTLAAYAAAILTALAIHFGIFYSATVWLAAGLGPLAFWRALREAFLTAFSTSSSAATLPVNMRCVERNLGVSRPVTSLVLSLGATINMDGTAIMQAVASVFIAQVYGLDLTIAQQAVILVMAVLASIATAPVPSAGIVMLGMIMVPLGIPLQGIALILAVDRFLDMCRTVVNITGDAACAVLVAATEGEKIKGGRT